MSKILIAEDNADFAISLKLALEANGYSVAVTSNGREALARQRDFGADILITDIMMPEADGVELLNWFRSEFPATRVVVISGMDKLDATLYLQTATLIGADATFRKPFKVTDLLDKLRTLKD